MCLAATVSYNIGIEHFYHHRKFYWTVLQVCTILLTSRKTYTLYHNRGRGPFSLCVLQRMQISLQPHLLQKSIQRKGHCFPPWAHMHMGRTKRLLLPAWERRSLSNLLWGNTDAGCQQDGRVGDSSPHTPKETSILTTVHGQEYPCGILEVQWRI